MTAITANSGNQSHFEKHILKVTNLHVHYGKVCAIENINLTAACGEAVAILGRNGTGKSTLLKAIAGLVLPATGRVEWCGMPLAKIRHEIGYLPQREDVDWNFPITVRGLVEMGRYPHVGWFGRFRKQDTLAVDQAIEEMDLGPIEHRQISELSGGQQQRAFIARALAQKAHIFLLDEPFAGLDQPSQETLMQIVRDLSATGHLVLASHHDLSNAPDIFNRAVLLDRRLIAEGLVTEVIQKMERQIETRQEVRHV